MSPILAAWNAVVLKTWRAAVIPVGTRVYLCWSRGAALILSDVGPRRDPAEDDEPAPERVAWR